MSDIPTVIFLDILRRQPVESLFRFRSVCKTWRDIIDDPAFAKQHIHRGIGQDWFFHEHDKSGKIFLLPFKELIYSNRRNSRIHCVEATNVKTLMGPCTRGFSVPSCNGLILLCNVKNNIVWRIWNPFTGDSLELGQCDEFLNVKGQSVYRAIGYDEANDDYKVVGIVGFRTYIYSVNSNKWRKIEDFPASLIGHEVGVLAHGAVHWFAYSREANWDDRWSVVALDLSTEKYRKIVLPSEIIQQGRRSLELNALNGCLFLICYGWSGNFVMWMIRDYGCEETWIEMISMEDKSNTSFTPLAYLKSTEQVLLHCNGWEYMWYDVEKKCSERLSIEVKNAYGFDDQSDCYKYINDTFSSQVFPASLIRLKRSDVSVERAILQRKSKRKRKGAMAIERLPLKLMLGDYDDIVCDDGTTFSDEPTGDGY